MFSFALSSFGQRRSSVGGPTCIFTDPKLQFKPRFLQQSAIQWLHQQVPSLQLYIQLLGSSNKLLCKNCRSTLLSMIQEQKSFIFKGVKLCKALLKVKGGCQTVQELCKNIPCNIMLSVWAFRQMYTQVVREYNLK